MNMTEVRALANWTEDSEPWADEFLRSLEPFINWTIHEKPGWHARKIADTLLVIWSARREADGKRWVHVSCSRPSRMPSWEDLREVKDTFIGRERKALQILPAASEYVNLHKYTLHLWHCLDGDGLPDFRREGTL